MKFSARRRRQFDPAEAEQYRRMMHVPRLDITRHVLAALDTGSIRPAGLVRELLRLWRGAGRLNPNEYFYYRLYDGRFSLAEKAAFIGKSAQGRMGQKCNDASWIAASCDKLLYQAIMQGAGAPVPEVIGICHPVRRLGTAATLRSAGEIAEFLRIEAIYPIFVKPIYGAFSIGAVSIDGFDRASDELLCADGERIAVTALAERYARRLDPGFVIQKRLEPHADMAALIGLRVPSVRMHVILGPDGPELFRASCKIPAGRNIADNYWRSGNLLAAVDPETGTLQRVVRGFGQDMEEVETHPDTGRRLMGATLPIWTELRDACLAAAPVMAGLRLQAWDVAVTERGPVLLECNYGGDFNLTQLPQGRGLLDARFCSLLETHGYKLPKAYASAS